MVTEASDGSYSLTFSRRLLSRVRKTSPIALEAFAPSGFRARELNERRLRTPAAAVEPRADDGA